MSNSQLLDSLTACILSSFSQLNCEQGDSTLNSHQLDSRGATCSVLLAD